MGNRAVICFKNTPSAIGIYVHWNGGPESILAFLHACEARGYRTPDSDPAYAMARLIGLICEFFGGAESIGVGKLSELDTDNGDNGLYIVGPGWEIKDRRHSRDDMTKTVARLAKTAKTKYNAIKSKMSKKQEGAE